MRNETVLCEKRERILFIRLNRPQRLNAVVSELYSGLLLALKDAEEDANIRAVVLTGEGRAFCVGADMKEHAAGTRTEQQKIEYLALGNSVCSYIRSHNKIVIAAVNGYAIGAGAEMACSSDFIIMKDTAEIGFPEVSLGTFVGGGITEILPRLVGIGKAREMLITGNRINGIEAERIGLANRVYSEDEFEAGVNEFAENIASKAPISLKFAKRHLNDFESNYHTRLKHEIDAIFTCMRSKDWQEGVDAFQEKRAPEFKGK